MIIEPRITTDLAGVIEVEVRIRPTIVNLLKDPRHQRGHLISRGIYAVLDALGFLVDWHGSKPSGTQRRYRDMLEVDADQEQLLAYYSASDDESVDYSQPHRATELRDMRSSSIRNGEHILIQGHDVVLFANTVINTTRSLYLSLFNPLEYAIIVHLTDYTDTLPEGLLPGNHSTCFSLVEDGSYEGMIPPSGHLALGPVLFHPVDFGTFSHYFVIMNNYTGLEPGILILGSLFLVLLAGRSIPQPIMLRDNIGFIDKVGMNDENNLRHCNWQFHIQEVLLKHGNLRLIAVS